MTVYLLEGYNTDSRYSNDVRYREYTTSKRRAELFNKIPKIQFSDSGHGICFSATEHKGRRQPCRTQLAHYVFEQMAKLTPQKISKPNKQALIDELSEALKVAHDALGTLLYKHPDDAIGNTQMALIENALSKTKGKG